MANRSQNNTTKSLFERKISRAKVIMLAEQIWPRLWLPMGIIGLFVLVSTFGLWSVLPLAAHIILLLVFALGLLASFAPLTNIRASDRHEAIRWLENKSGLAHRPASVLEDQPSQQLSQPANSLWQAHKQQARDHVQAMKTGLPHPRTERFDPFALRVPLILALAITGGLFAHQMVPGFWQAFEFDKTPITHDLRIDAWLTPPRYTGKPPIMLVDGAKPLTLRTKAEGSVSHSASLTKSIQIPESSQLVVRSSGPDAQHTRLVVNLPGVETNKPKPAQSAHHRTAKVTIKQEGAVRELRVKLMHTFDVQLHKKQKLLKTWHFVVTKDHVPAITFTKKPAQSPRGSLRIAYRIADDFGVIDATAHISKTTSRPVKFGLKTNHTSPSSSPIPNNLLVPLGSPPKFSLLLPKGKAKRGSASTYKDLTAHPWAGLDVEMVLMARDEAGKIGKSKRKQLKLPERKFTKPLARALIKQRRQLVERPYDHQKVARNLNIITNMVPPITGQMIEDKGVFLAIRGAYWQLQRAYKRQTIRAVVDQLWEIALTIEDGNLSKAERQLRNAQDRLMDALSRNASPKEIAQLMKELRQALSQFLQAMAKNQQNQQQNSAQQQIPGNQRTLSAKQLDKMLKDIENMAKTGARDAAKQMLSQLRNMLENLNNGRSQPSDQAQKQRKQLDELGKMIMQQRRLLDETHQQKQQGKQGQTGGRRAGQKPGKGVQQGQQNGQQQGRAGGFGQQPGSSGGRGPRGQQGGSGDQRQRSGANGLGQRQGQLLDGLNELMDQMGRMGTNIPRDLMRAGSNMGQAENQLSRQQLGAAGRQQGKALENLRSGAGKLMEQMRRNGQAQGQPNQQGNRDPLGRARRTSGPDFGEDVKVPKQIDTQRARDILEELRRRLGQSTRPPAELDYLERLIEQF